MLIASAFVRAAVPGTITDGIYDAGNGAAFEIVIRSSMSAAVSILDLLKVHLTDVERELAGRVVIGRGARRADRASRELLVVRVPHLPMGDTLARCIAQISEEPAWRTAAWAIISDGGGYFIHLDDEQRIREQPDDVKQTGPRLAAQAIASMRDPLHSDVAITLLGLLLLRSATARRTWLHPLLKAETLGELATELGVSRAALYMATESLEDRSWVATRHGRLPQLVNIPAVVTWFIDRYKHRRRDQVAVTPGLAGWKDRADLLRWLTERRADPTATGKADLVARNMVGDWAVTGWAACNVHGLSVLTDALVKPVEVVVRHPISSVMSAWGLEESRSTADIVLHLSRTETPLATFSGVVDLRNQGQAEPGARSIVLPVVDPWQAALAVANDQQRGIEQAQAIADSLWPTA